MSEFLEYYPHMFVQEDAARERYSLSVADRTWLAQMGALPDGLWLDEFNSLIGPGSCDLRLPINQDHYEEIVSARFRGLELLGYTPEAIQALEANDRVLLPLHTMTETTKLLAQRGFDPNEVAVRHPRALRLRAETIQRKLGFLAERGIEVAKMIHDAPDVLSDSVEGMADTLDHIVSMGLDPIRVAQGNPNIFHYSNKRLTETRIVISKAGADAVKVCNEWPQVLSYDPATLQRKIDDFIEKGLDVVHILKYNSGALGIDLEKLNAIMAVAEKYKISPQQLLNGSPRLLGTNVTLLEERIVTFIETGLDVAKHPYMLATSIERMALQTVALEKMGINIQKLLRQNPTLIWTPFESFLERKEAMELIGFDYINPSST